MKKISKNDSILLVTTSIERTWGKDENLLFLGEWCRLYARKESWSKKDAVVLSYHWDDRQKLYNDYQSFGSHSLIWNASNMASGVYYINLDLNGQSETNKVMLVK